MPTSGASGAGGMPGTPGSGAVLVPAYDDPSDEVATAVIGAAHPGRRVLSIPCRPLIWQNGSLHCVTMQLPKGVLAI